MAHFERFAEGPARTPLRLLWISAQTTDAVALAQNNIGACHLNARRPERAVPILEAACARDGSYAIPHLNLAIAYRMMGDAARSEAHAAAALQLGYERDALQRAIEAATASHNVKVGALLRDQPR